MSEHARYSIGELIHHRLFGYRGVIIDVDPVFQGSEAWYQQMARSRPPKDQPWYHVLVHESDHRTYVAERNLERDTVRAPIEHPEIQRHLGVFRDGAYTPQHTAN